MMINNLIVILLCHTTDCSHNTTHRQLSLRQANCFTRCAHGGTTGSTPVGGIAWEVRKPSVSGQALAWDNETIEWPSEGLAEELSRNANAYNEEPDMVTALREWNMGYSSREWK
jgi:hypothetical protein